jgi:ABC-type antimicrobial peptide transport system permease subunit
MVYTPLAQPGEAFDGSMGYPERLTAVIRTNGDPTAILASARRAVSLVSKDVPISYVRTMEQQLDAALVRERLLANMSGGFGLLALCLAFVGLYGVMSYTVARRTREIGIRIALGATSALILGRMLRETLAVSGIGIILGLAATAATTKILSAFLFGLSPRDPTTLGLVTMILTAIAVIAGYVPARRAAGIDPMRTLKAE